VPEVVYWSMVDLKGFEKNPPTFIKGKFVEPDYDFDPKDHNDYNLVASCESANA